MAKFLTATEINVALEKLIREAKKTLILISPYIKLHDRLKDELKRKRDLYNLDIGVVFGKNETDVIKSLGADDLDFFISLPNISIYYEKNLHAKYYANEHDGIITSMNLHQYSQNSNIEIGVIYEHTIILDKVVNSVVDAFTGKHDIGDKVWTYFNDMIDNCEVVYKKAPEYDTKLLGITKKYKQSKEEVNRLTEFFGTKSNKFESISVHNFDVVSNSNKKKSVPDTMNIYQMYESNNYNLGFYIKRETWSSRIAKVISIEGVINGNAINGQPPYYGNPIVMAEFYNARSPQECNQNSLLEVIQIGTPGSYSFIMV